MNPQNSFYICPVCKRAFQHLSEWIKHTDTKHGSVAAFFYSDSNIKSNSTSEMGSASTSTDNIQTNKLKKCVKKGFKRNPVFPSNKLRVDELGTQTWNKQSQNSTGNSVSLLRANAKFKLPLMKQCAYCPRLLPTESLLRLHERTQHSKNLKIEIDQIKVKQGDVPSSVSIKQMPTLTNHKQAYLESETENLQSPTEENENIEGSFTCEYCCKSFKSTHTLMMHSLQNKCVKKSAPTVSLRGIYDSGKEVRTVFTVIPFAFGAT